MKKLVIFSLFGALLFCLCWCKNQSYIIWSTVITITNAKEVEVPIAVVKSDKKAIKDSGNYLPIFDDLTLSLPWFENVVQVLNSGVLSSNFDLTVKVTATNAEDLDWSINYFKWYYYYKDDPDRRLETKITPGTVNHTYFQFKRWNVWEYAFWVTMYDNNDWELESKKILWNDPTIFLISDSKNLDVPIVTLKSNKATVYVWEEVVFDVVCKTISNIPDFTQEREIRYDFDGDWEWDLITKDNHVTYVYKKSNLYWYVPRVGVVYRWNMWTAKWWSIVVKDRFD